MDFLTGLFGGFVSWWEEVFKKDKDAKGQDIGAEDESESDEEGENKNS